jgi:hypothetical protein
MREVYFFNALVEFANGSRFPTRTEERRKTGEGTVKRLDRAFDHLEQRLDGGDHDKAIPQASAKLQYLSQELIGLLPKAANDAKVGATS